MSESHTRRRFAAVLAGALLALAGAAGAQSPFTAANPALKSLAPKDAPPAAKAPTSSREEIKRALDAAQAALGKIESSGGGEGAPPDTPPADLAERTSLARQLASLFQQQLDLLDRTEALRGERADAERALEEWRGFPDPPPYPVLTVDALRDDVDSADARIRNAASRRALLDSFGAAVAAKAGPSQAAARLAAEAADAVSGSPAHARRAWTRDLAALQARVDEATREIVDMGLRNAREEDGTARAVRELAVRKLDATGAEFTLPPADLARVRAEIETRQRSADRDIERALRAVAAAVQARDAAEARLAEARQPRKGPPEDPAARAARESPLHRDVEAKREIAVTAELRANLLKEYRVLLGGEARAWDARAEALRTRSPIEARAIFEKVSGSLATVRTWGQYLEQQLASTRSLIQEQETKLRMTTGDDAVLASQLVETFRQRENDVNHAIDLSQPLVRLLRHFRADLEGRREVSFAERAKDAAAAALLALRRAWAFELFTVDDTFETADGRRLAVSRSITLGKTVGAVLIVVLGYLLVSFVARRVERLVVGRGHVAPQTAAALRNWVLFALTAILVVLALVSASIPLTAFAFLGGALAIAAGFGLQTLLKNLVAGIILLASRPMRLGDLVEVDGTRGRVTEIGLRASTILTADGIESLIPNSAFLEGKLTNWTYTSQQTRQTINVGVAYGTSLREATEALAGALERHGLVLKSPAPQVYLDGYGDSSVNFALTYWVEMTPNNDVRRIKSDLLHMIDTAFAEAGIRMPFPQRDVHVDTAAPLKVELVPGSKPSA
jgi:potassium-dependent mechanosensitive channel